MKNTIVLGLAVTGMILIGSNQTVEAGPKRFAFQLNVGGPQYGGYHYRPRSYYPRRPRHFHGGYGPYYMPRYGHYHRQSFYHVDDCYDGYYRRGRGRRWHR